MEMTEKKAASYVRKSLVSIRSKVVNISGKYGEDFPGIEGTLEDILNSIDKASDSLSPEAYDEMEADKLYELQWEAERTASQRKLI